VTPVGQITLHVTFGTWENYRTEYMQFEIADFEMAYNAFLEMPALTKFMVIPRYAYLNLKMPGSNSVISIKGGVSNAPTTAIGRAVRLPTCYWHM
jgi:hypothetical protein